MIKIIPILWLLKVRKVAAILGLLPTILFGLFIKLRWPGKSDAEVYEIIKNHPVLNGMLACIVSVLFIFIGADGATHECPYTGTRSGLPNLMFCVNEYVAIFFTVLWFFLGGLTFWNWFKELGKKK